MGYFDEADMFPIKPEKKTLKMFGKWLQNPCDVFTNNPYFISWLNNLLYNTLCVNGVYSEYVAGLVFFPYQIEAVFIFENKEEKNCLDEENGLILTASVNILSETLSKIFYCIMNVRYDD